MVPCSHPLNSNAKYYLAKMRLQNEIMCLENGMSILNTI